MDKKIVRELMALPLALAVFILMSLLYIISLPGMEKMLTATQYEQRHKYCQEKGYSTLARTNSRDEVIEVSCVKNIANGYYPKYVGEKP